MTIVHEVTTATATTIEDEVQARPPDVGYLAEAGVRTGTGAGVAAPEIGTGDDRPQGLHLHPLDSAVGLIRVHRPLVALGDPERTHLLLEEIPEATVPCLHHQGAVHLLLADVMSAVRLAAIVDLVHRQGPPRGRALPRGDVVVPLPPVLLCRLVLEGAGAEIKRRGVSASTVTFNYHERVTVLFGFVYICPISCNMLFPTFAWSCPIQLRRCAMLPGIESDSHLCLFPRTENPPCGLSRCLLVRVRS